MSKILEKFHELVPALNHEGHLTLPNGSVLDFDDTRFYKLFLREDQLTVARVRGAQALRASHDVPHDRLEGIIPVIEDWHPRMTLMRVSNEPRIDRKQLKMLLHYYRLYGKYFIPPNLLQVWVPCTNYGIWSIDLQFQQILGTT